MNLPLFLPGMQNFIVVCLAFLAGAAIAVYLLKYKFKKSAVRKCLIVFVLAIIGVVLVCILFYTGSSIIGRSQVETQLAKMRAQGIPLDKESIFPKMPEKDSDNGAYYYKAVFELMRVSSSYNAIDDMSGQQPSLDIAAWSDQSMSTARQLINTQEIEQILSLFRQGSEKPYAVYEREYRGCSTKLPELVFRRGLFRLISIKSCSNGINGNPEAGYCFVHDGFNTIKQLESEPFLISQLVNILCVSLNINAMNTLISRYGISSQSAKQFISELNKFDFRASMVHSLDLEILIGREVFEKVIKEYRLGEEELKPDIERIISIWSFFYQDYTYFLIQQTKNRMLYSKPYWLEEEEMKELSSKISKIPRRYWISRIMFPHLTIIRTKIARIESEIDSAKLTLALHIYKNQHGEFPDKLEELAPEILKEIPVDPISGKPFEYSKTGNAFTISSVWLQEKAEIYRKNRSMHNSGK